ncbi:MAG: hypothetical protein K9I94_09110 [Bacteroidales bacterium]|nr:hypothetical protein [Bacteroidales bacterium]
MKKINLILVVLLTSLIAMLTYSCSSEKEKERYTVSNFTPFNWGEIEKDTVPVNVDLNDAIISGIRIPTANQTQSGKFDFSFSVKNNSGKNTSLYYKLYYQNESYKHPLTSNMFSGTKYNPEAAQNFYGSWKDLNVQFKKAPSLKKGDEIEISDSFCIVGNPRDEKKYYGKSQYSKELIDIIESIKNDNKWFNKVEKDAQEKNNTLEKQLYLDAKYVLKHRDKEYNNRWKRNPRVGVYSFMLVVASEKAINEIPEYIKDISKRNGDNVFVNPYYYFMHGDGAKLNGVQVIKADKHLKASAHMQPKKGVYVDFSNTSDPKCYDSLCGQGLDLFRNAHYKHHFNYINKQWPFHNIPLVRDIFEDEYSREDFNRNKKKYDDKRIKDFPENPEFPCSTIIPDPNENTITLINPGNKDKEKPAKQQIAIETRIGLTYGKFRGKIKFPELINKYNVWNGVTNAFWLFTHSRKNWNKRDICEEGYVAKGGGDKKNIEYVDRATYSEIDFEIVKASKYWSKKKKPHHKGYEPEEADDIIVACTNWDLACQDPPNFGEPEMEYGGEKYFLHRWYDTYRALTSKKPMIEDEMFKRDYYYYEIGWYPDSIVWKIGPSLDKLKTICYMDETVTKIPNNQMVMMVSQEFHHGDWWPTTPFHQNNIPYPKNDIKGVIYEMWIE